MRYQVAPTVTGKYLVMDTRRSYETVAADLTKAQADAWAARLNHREAWGL